MTKLLIKIFIKDKNVKNLEVRNRYAMLSSITGIILNKCPSHDSTPNLYKSALAMNLIGFLLIRIIPAASK